ncbi:MAG TPA: hypothetical protein PLO78_06335, partial [Candidatus Omnitrophota bacterium]|nr:hypothetical protein [Candidatus Omnitrophota bacterium]
MEKQTMSICSRDQRHLSRSVRIIALLTNFFFIANTVAFGQTTVFSNGTGYLSAVALVRDLKIPAAFGTVQQRHAAGRASVILIRDAHSQIGAQRNIEKMLSYLKTQYGIKALFLEGAFRGPIPKNLLHYKKDDRVNLELAERLLGRGLAGGAGLFLSRHAKDTVGYGVEDPELYVRNVKQFRAIYQEKPAADRFLAAFAKKLLTRGSRVFRQDLNQFLREWLAHQESRREVLNYFELLAQHAKRVLRVDLKDPWNQFEYPQLTRLFALRHFEKASVGESPEEIKKEKAALFAWLGSVPVRAVAQSPNGRLPRPEQALLEMILSSEDHVASMDLRTYFEDFEALYRSRGFSFEKYPALKRRIGKLILASEIDAEKMNGEADRLTGKILCQMARSDEERELTKLFRYYVLLRKLFSLELGKKEYLEIRGQAEDMLPSHLLKQSGFPAEGPDKEIDTLFKHALGFYQTAVKRETVMFANILQTIQNSKPEKSALVVGGFHSEGLEALLKSHGISYVSIVPRIGKLESGRNYLENITLKPVSGPHASTVPAYSVDRLKISDLRPLDMAGAVFLERVVREELGRLEPESAIFRSVSKLGKIRAPVLKMTATTGARSELRSREPGELTKNQKLRNLFLAFLIFSQSVQSTVGQILMEIQQAAGSREARVTMNISPDLTPGEFEVQGTTDFQTWQTLTNFSVSGMTQDYARSFQFNFEEGLDRMFMRGVRTGNAPTNSEYTLLSATNAPAQTGYTNIITRHQVLAQGATYEPPSPAVSISRTVSLAWDPSPDAWVTGYIIYYYTIGDETNLNSVVLGNVTNVTISNIVENVTNVFYAVATDAQGNKSEPSNTITYSVKGTNAVAVHPEPFDRIYSLLGWTNVIGNWELQNEKVNHIASVTQNGMLILDYVAHTQDFDVKADFDFKTPALDMGRGMIVSYQDASNYYYGQYDRLNSRYRIIRVQNGVSTVLAETIAPAIPDNSTHTIQITKKDARLELYFDNNLVAQTDDATFGFGKVGIYSGSYDHTVDNFFFIQRYVDLSGIVPAPIVDNLPQVTKQNPITISGTKPPDTAILINGQEVVPLDGLTDWSVSYPLLEQGTNTLTITAKNGSGTESSPVVIHIQLDQVAPAIQFTSPALTNNPNYNLVYTVDGVAKSVAKTLAEGVNVLSVTESDAAGNVTEREFSVTLDTLPPVVSVLSANAVGDADYVLRYTADGIEKTRNVTLQAGDNALNISETDAAGNQTVFDFHVQYTPAAVSGHDFTVHGGAVLD